MNKKGLSVLDSLILALGASTIDCVVTAHDAGTVNDYHDEICDLCAANEIQRFDRKQDPGLRDGVAVSIAVGWRWMLHAEPNLVVFHDSLLPKYRGFAPLVSALLNRESHIGVTALLASERFDEGDIIGREEIAIQYPIAVDRAIDLISECYATLACRIMSTFVAGVPIQRIPQDHSAATYSAWRDEEDYRIDWTASSADIRQFVLAVGFPYRGASSLVNSRPVRILGAEPVEGYRMARPAHGKILYLEHGMPHVVSGSGLVRVTQMVSSETRESLLPWTLLRSRFT